MDASQFREAMGRWASGVTIVAARHESHVVATTVSAFLSLSADPPLVLIALGANATVLPFLEPQAVFGISVLAAAQRRLAAVFADPFPVIPNAFDDDDPPLIADALVRLRCSVRETHAAGDHTIIIAAVAAVEFGEAAPLVRFRRSYHGIAAR